MKPKILFVDDEPNILAGLQRLLRPRRAQWAMVYALGGPEAIAMMEGEAFDVIVSDMRMPEFDGADVIEAAARLHPQAMRFILSGESDRDLTLRTVGLSHRFLSKPCSADTLIGAIERALSARTRYLAKADPGQANDLIELTTPPDVYAAFAGVLETAPEDSERLVAIAKTDPALSARLLQLANSAYFGRPLEGVSIARAIERVGTDVLKELLRLERLSKVGAGALPADLEPGAIAQAAYERALSVTSDLNIAEEAYAVGLMLMLGAQAPNGSKISFAAYLAEIMGLPETVCAALHGLCGLPQEQRDDPATAIVVALSAANSAQAA